MLPVLLQLAHHIDGYAGAFSQFLLCQGRDAPQARNTIAKVLIRHKPRLRQAASSEGGQPPSHVLTKEQYLRRDHSAPGAGGDACTCRR